jgi:Fic family protein
MVVQKPPRKIFDSPEEFSIAFDLQSDQEMRDYIFDINEKYLHWDEIRHRNHPKGIASEMMWSLLKLSRLSQYRAIHLGEVIFRYVLTDNILKSLQKLDQQTSGTLESKTEYLAPEGPLEKYLINSIMEEAVATSQLEGAVTTREVAKEMLRMGKKPKDESQHMIVNAYQTLRYLKSILNLQLSPELICQIHSRITKNTLEDGELGEFRKTNEIHVIDVATGDPVYTPPDYRQVPKMVESLCEFMNSEGRMFLHPILKAIILHFMIGYIHPFVDGNGRTARALFYWYVLKQGYWLFEYMPISRVIKEASGRYSRAYIFTETDQNDLTYFIVFNLRQLKIALRDFVDYIKQKREESRMVRELLEHDNMLNFRQSDIILRFMKHPLKQFSIREIQKTYNVAYETARTDLDLLSQLHYCKKIVEGKKYVYVYIPKSEKRS